ncbi:MAG: T9SS type A sorting domain-containing protein, partial [Bacteroidota bacterium]
SGDSTSVVGIDKQAAAFKVTAGANGREVVARWNGSGASDSSRVALYLDNDQKGFNGIYVGSVNESAGEFHYTMTDSLPDCGYYLYAMRVGTGGDGSSIYSDTYLPNPKTSLFPPANLHAVATPAGDVTVTWDQTSEPGVLQHIIRVTDKDGNDSLYTPIDFNYTMATIHVDDWGTKKISIVSRNDANRQGCWSEPVSFVLADVEERITGGDHSVGIEIHVAPQPVINRTTIFANLTGSAHLSIDLYDIDGRKVMLLKEGTFERGTLRADLDASKLPAGIYIIRIVGDGISGSKKISVGK